MTETQWDNALKTDTSLKLKEQILTYLDEKGFDYRSGTRIVNSRVFAQLFHVKQLRKKMLTEVILPEVCRLTRDLSGWVVSYHVLEDCCEFCVHLPGHRMNYWYGMADADYQIYKDERILV